MTMLGMDASLAVLGVFALGFPAAGNFRSAHTMSTSSAATPRLTRIPFFIFITLFQARLNPRLFSGVTARTYSENQVYPTDRSAGSGKSILKRTAAARR